MNARRTAGDIDRNNFNNRSSSRRDDDDGIGGEASNADAH